MPGIAGRKARVKISTTSGGTYSVVQGIRQATVTLDGAIIDDSEFGSEWAQKMQGLKGLKISLSGNRRAADATGQNVLMGMFTGSTATIFVQYLPDNGVTANIGFQCEMILASIGNGAAVDGAVEFNAELEGAGTPTVI